MMLVLSCVYCLAINVESMSAPCDNSPHCAAVEVDKHPLVGVHVKGLGKLNSLHQGSELRADEGAPSVTCVHVKPSAKFLDGFSIILTIQSD